jgi:hypothetical protein
MFSRAPASMAASNTHHIGTSRESIKDSRFSTSHSLELAASLPPQASKPENAVLFPIWHSE